MSHTEFMRRTLLGTHFTRVGSSKAIKTKNNWCSCAGRIEYENDACQTNCFSNRQIWGKTTKNNKRRWKVWHPSRKIRTSMRQYLLVFYCVTNRVQEWCLSTVMKREKNKNCSPKKNKKTKMVVLSCVPNSVRALLWQITFLRQTYETKTNHGFEMLTTLFLSVKNQSPRFKTTPCVLRVMNLKGIFCIQILMNPERA